MGARSRDLQEVVWQLAVEEGVQPIVRACRALHDKGNWDLADPNFDQVLIHEINEQRKYIPPLGDLLIPPKKEQERPKARDR